MSSAQYAQNRRKWNRPQGLLFANEPGILDGTVYVPQGLEKEDFIVLSDHNRAELDLGFQRIEDRRRMINGTMRSYFVADKRTLSTSWNMLPSRSASDNETYGFDGKLERLADGRYPQIYTVDGGAGGTELLDWYETHSGPFWVFMAYDKYTAFAGADKYSQLDKYSEILHMYISSFSYSVVKRGQNMMDLWNVSISLEEV